MALVVKNLSASAEDTRDADQSLGQEDALKEGTATHSSIFAWRIPWTEEPGRLQSIASQRVGHKQLSTHAHIHVLKDICRANFVI